jgi:hypothetical protein
MVILLTSVTGFNFSHKVTLKDEANSWKKQQE